MLYLFLTLIVRKDILIKLSIWIFYLTYYFSTIYLIIKNNICPYGIFGHPILSLYLCSDESEKTIYL